ncbi:MAG: ankyrin repeat domain-containing protein, partial [Bacteroidota bacterium]
IAVYGSIIHAMTHPRLRNLARYLALEYGALTDLAYAAAVGSIPLMEICWDQGMLDPAKAYHRYRPPKHQRVNPSNAFILGEALIYAAITGRLEATKWLLSKGAAPEVVAPIHEEYPNALQAAIWGNWPEVVQYLLEQQANPHQTDPVHQSDAMGWATFLNRPQLIPIIQSFL